MADKYEDLHDEIADSIHWDATVVDTLKWLDEHPNQAPGRTITESELRVVAGRLFARWPDLGVFMGHLQRELSELGITVTPDPEPTNAEKLAHYVRQMDLTPMSPNECGKWLDEQGVKAPGGDDD